MMTFSTAFHARVYGYLAILTDDYPPIGIEEPAGSRAPAPARATPAARSGG